MGSVRASFAGLVLLVVVPSTPIVSAAEEDTVSVHGIEAAAVSALAAAAEVNAPWQPLYVGVDEVTEGLNPIISFGVVSATPLESVSRLAESLPQESPIDTIQTGSNSLYQRYDRVTFALIETPSPTSAVGGELAEFSFHWRLAGSPTQPADPSANGDATVDASHTFSMTSEGDRSRFSYSQSDGSRFVPRNGNSIAAWQFVADGVYHLLVAIPGSPESVWASAVNASTLEAADVTIQIVPDVVGVADRTLVLRAQHTLSDPELIDSWTKIVSGRISVADLAGSDAGSADAASPIEGGAAFPASPPLEVDESGDPVMPSNPDAAGSLWRWIVGGFLGAGLLGLLIWLLGFRSTRSSGSANVVHLSATDGDEADSRRRDTSRPRSRDVS